MTAASRDEFVLIFSFACSSMASIKGRLIGYRFYQSSTHWTLPKRNALGHACWTEEGSCGLVSSPPSMPLAMQSSLNTALGETAGLKVATDFWQRSSNKTISLDQEVSTSTLMLMDWEGLPRPFSWEKNLDSIVCLNGKSSAKLCADITQRQGARQGGCACQESCIGPWDLPWDNFTKKQRMAKKQGRIEKLSMNLA